MKTPRHMRPWMMRLPSALALLIVVVLLPMAVAASLFVGAWKEAKEVGGDYIAVIMEFFTPEPRR